MDIKGDGQKTIFQLISEHPIAKHRMPEMEAKHGGSFAQVLEKGEQYLLTYAANLNRGARFSDLRHEISDTLQEIFDRLSHHTKFYYGRYDIKCNSVEEFREGKHFTILEFNGSGAEPNHVYHTGYSLFGAYRVILFHWKVLFRISRYNHRQGIHYWPLKKGWQFMKSAQRHLELLKKYDAIIPV
jgi:hypothetical protein